MGSGQYSPMVSSACRKRRLKEQPSVGLTSLRCVKRVPKNKNYASDQRCDGQEQRWNRMPDHNNDEIADDNQDNETVERVLPSAQAATTKTGKPRQRMAWTREMNITVMRCYYTATHLEAIKVGYGLELFKLFTEIYPEMTQTVTPQRLIDQKRVILRNKKLTDREIQDIKEDIAIQLNTHSGPQRDNSNHQARTHTPPRAAESIQPPKATTPPILQLSRTPQIQTPRIRNTNSNNTIDEEIQANITKWTGINPENRPQLPKLIYKKDTFTIIFTVNAQLENYLYNTDTLEDIHLLVYAAATTVLKQNKQLTQNKTNHKTKQAKPKWKIRLENKINNIRKHIGRLTQYCKGNHSKPIIKYLAHIINNNHNKETPTEILDTLKQKLAAYSARLKRYNESSQRKIQNKQFNRNEKLFYKSLEKQEEIRIIPPNTNEIKNFWENIWSNPKQHKETATWITEEYDKNVNTPQQTDHIVTIEELRRTIQKTHNWKAPGIDHIHNFWYKQFTSIHQHLTMQINKIILEPQNMPQFLTQGKTYIIPKNEHTQNPANYRPITCLPTLYKIITALITQKIDKHLIQNNILTEEQKGCRRNSKGCKEQVIIDSIIMKQVEKQKRNMVTCYIDYKKAFDSIPHSWLLKVLQIYKIDLHIQNFLRMTMKTWRTAIHLNTNHEQIEIKNIKITRGIFQGDSLSALWFCLCLNPLSNILNNTTYGFKIKHQNTPQHTINHLLYMDDIKIFASNKTQMQSLLRITEQFTQDTCMEFGINKCKMLHIDKGKCKQQNITEVLNNETLENMEPQETYKYLGFEQNTSMNHTHIKEQLKRKYTHRLTLILKSKLNAKNIIKAVNTYAIPVLTYSFGIVKWSNTDLEAINRLNRIKLTEHRKLHPNSCIERVTISRKEGGRGLIDLQTLHNTQIENLRKYFKNRDTLLHQAITKADKQYTPLNLQQNDTQKNTHANTTQHKKETWARKPLHGNHYNIMQNPQIDTQLSYKWLTSGQLFPETEGFVLAIQDRVIATRNYRKYIIKENIEIDTCRKCHQYKETIEHITGGCKILAGTDYTDRHNAVAKIIHQELALKHGLTQTETPYYKYTPKNVAENDNYKLYWDRTLYTDKTIVCNRPDITLLDKTQKHTYIIDISIPNDSNVIQKETEKIEKYTPLAIELKEIWKQNRISIVPIIMSVTGITTRTFIQNLRTIDLPAHIHTNIQKAVILKTSTIVRKFMQ